MRFTRHLKSIRALRLRAGRPFNSERLGSQSPENCQRWRCLTAQGGNFHSVGAHKEQYYHWFLVLYYAWFPVAPRLISLLAVCACPNNFWSCCPAPTKLDRGVAVSEILTSFKFCENRGTGRDETQKIFCLRGRLQCKFLLIPMILCTLRLVFRHQSAMPWAVLEVGTSLISSSEY